MSLSGFLVRYWQDFRPGLAVDLGLGLARGFVLFVLVLRSGLALGLVVLVLELRCGLEGSAIGWGGDAPACVRQDRSG